MVSTEKKALLREAIISFNAQWAYGAWTLWTDLGDQKGDGIQTPMGRIVQPSGPIKPGPGIQPTQPFTLQCFSSQSRAMAKALFRILRRASPKPSIFQLISCHPESIFSLPKHPPPPTPSWVSRNLSHGSVNLVISRGKLKFETHETDPPKKDKWKTKKRLKMQRKKEKQKRKSANKRDPRRLSVKGKKKKQRFANAEERIKFKLEKVIIFFCSELLITIIIVVLLVILFELLIVASWKGWDY